MLPIRGRAVASAPGADLQAARELRAIERLLAEAPQQRYA